MNTYYEILNISPNATQEEIRTAYQNRARELHPDKNPSDQQSFKQIQEAHETLSDNEKRKKYDESLKQSQTPQLVFVLNDDNGPTDTECRSLVVRKTVSFATAAQLAKLDRYALTELANKDSAVAEAIYESTELSKILGIFLLKIAFNHEQLACQILMNDDEAYLNSITYQDSLHILAKKYWKACKIILTRPVLFKQLYCNDLYNLKLQYQEEFQKVACPEIQELVAIDSYFTEIYENGLPPEVDKSELLYKLKKIRKDKDTLIKIAQKFLPIAELIFEDQELFKELSYSFARIALSFETLSCKLLSSRKIYITSGWLFDMAKCYWSCCQILLCKPELYNQLSLDDLIKLQIAYTSQFDENCDITLREKIHLAQYLEKLLKATSELEIDASKLQKILVDMNNKHNDLIFILCKKYRLAAEIYINTPALLNNVDYRFISVCIHYETLLNTVLQQQKYWPSHGFIESSLEEAAIKYKSSCIIILSVEKHYRYLTGSTLHKLSIQYGVEVAQLINTNPHLLKRLRAALLFANSNAQSKKPLQHEVPQTTDTDAEMFYFTGCIYRDQKTNGCIEIAMQNFHQAALLGHSKSMSELEQLVNKDNIEYGLKIIQILTDSNNTLYDAANALCWFDKLITDKNSETILSIIQHKYLWNFLIKNLHLLIRLAKIDVNICRFILETPELNQDFSGEVLYDLINLYKDEIAQCIIHQKYLFKKLTDAILDHLNIYLGNQSNTNHYIKHYLKIARFLFENNNICLGESYLYKSSCRGDNDSLTEYISYIKKMTAADKNDPSDTRNFKTKLKIVYQVVLFFIVADPHNPLHDKTMTDSLFQNFIIKFCDETMICKYLHTYLVELMDSDSPDAITAHTRACTIIKNFNQHYNPSILFDALGDQFSQQGSIKEAQSYYLTATLMKSERAFNKLINVISSDDIQWQLLILLVYSDMNNIFFNRQEIEKRTSLLKPEMHKKLSEIILHYLDQKHILDSDYPQHQLNYLTKFIEGLTTDFKSIPPADIYYHIGCIFYQMKSLTIARPLLNLAASHGSYAAGVMLMQLINPIEKCPREQIEHDSFNPQDDYEIKNLIALANKIIDKKNELLNIEQFPFKTRFYFYFSALRLVVPKQSRTIQSQYLYESLYMYARDTYIVFHSGRLVIKDLTADNATNHQSILRKCHYLIDDLFRDFIDFPVIRHNLSNELYNIANHADIGDSQFYEKLKEIYLRYKKLIQQIGTLNNQRNALIKITRLLNKHIVELSERMQYFEENNDVESKTFYYKRVNLLTAFNNLIVSILDKHYSGDLSADIHKIDSDTIHQTIREHIEVLLSKESDLVRHYRWLSEQFAEHLPKIHSLFGTRFENNSVQIFKEKIIPKLDRSFGNYFSTAKPHSDSKSFEMRELNQFDHEPNDDIDGIELKPRTQAP